MLGKLAGRERLWLLAGVVASVGPLAAGRAEGQLQQTTVQLPTYHHYGVSTTVVVPDRGGIYLGGIGRRRLDQAGYRVPPFPLGQRAMGTGRVAGGLSAHVTVIDLGELDRAVLAEAARRRGREANERDRPAQGLSSGSRNTRQQTVRKEDGQTLDRSAGQLTLADRYLRRAQQAEAEGRLHAAVMFYQGLDQHGRPSQQRLAKHHLSRLEVELAQAQ